MNERTFTAEQSLLISELVAFYGLDASQISFEGTDPTPIFDYEANSLLSLKLTDISMDCWIAERDEAAKIATSKCKVTLPDGRWRSVEDSAAVGEIQGDGTKVENIRHAEALSRSRASRLGIRSVGVNLYRAHKNFVKTGEVVQGNTNHHPRKPAYDEIHVLAGKIGFITGSDRSEYVKFLYDTFDGKVSASDLDDIELQRLLTTFRAMDRVKRARNKVVA